MTENELRALAAKVADALVATSGQLVLAESCTAGLAAATLGSIAGISHNFCGSAVVYQEATKTAWIGVDPSILTRFGTVSAEVAIAMVAGVLAATSHANIAAAITGHLGPGAPADLDGKLFVAVQRRGDHAPQMFPHHLPGPEGQLVDQSAIRHQRQLKATALLLANLYDVLAK